MSWLGWMFLCAVFGAEAGIFYPTFVRYLKADLPLPTYVTLDSTSSGAARWVRLVIFSILIAAVVAALGFVAFLGDKHHQQELRATGWLAYFAAFTYGFAGGSLFEEPLRRS